MYIIYSVSCKHFTQSVVRTTLTAVKLYKLLCQLCTLLTQSVVNIYSVGCVNSVSCAHYVLGRL